MFYISRLYTILYELLQLETVYFKEAVSSYKCSLKCVGVVKYKSVFSISNFKVWLLMKFFRC